VPRLAGERRPNENCPSLAASRLAGRDALHEAHPAADLEADAPGEITPWRGSIAATLPIGNP
jgi:hypothetical protein